MRIFRNGQGIELTKFEMMMVYAHLELEYCENSVIRRLVESGIELPQSSIPTVVAKVKQMVSEDKTITESYLKHIDNAIEQEIQRLSNNGGSEHEW